jgi:hypothetical protein
MESNSATALDTNCHNVEQNYPDECDEPFET